MGSQILNRLREVTQKSVDNFYGLRAEDVTTDDIRRKCMDEYSKLLLSETISCQVVIYCNEIRVEVCYGPVTFFVP